MDKQTKLLEAGKCCEKATNSKPCCDYCVAESMGYASQYDEESNKSTEPNPHAPYINGDLNPLWFDWENEKDGLTEPQALKSTAELRNMVKSLESGLKQCQSDRDEVQEANDKLEKQNSELREALQRIADATDGNNPGHAVFYFEARKVLTKYEALNSKEVGNG